MGMLFNSIYEFMNEFKDKPSKGNILQIGKQDIYYNLETINQIAKSINYDLNQISSTDIKLSNKYKDCITDTTFFKLMGFNSVASLDVSDYEEADIIWDMNKPIPEEYYEKFDTIYDGGTCEHVFNTGIFLENICRMVKNGGTIIHELPVSGLIDHGFYSFSPTLFYDYYTANGFKINQIDLFKQKNELKYEQLWNRIEYIPGMYDKNPYIQDNDLINIRVSVSKIKNFDELTIPQQSMWSRLDGSWNKNNIQTYKNLRELVDTVIEAINYLICNYRRKSYIISDMYKDIELAIRSIYEISINLIKDRSIANILKELPEFINLIASYSEKSNFEENKFKFDMINTMNNMILLRDYLRKIEKLEENK